MNSDSDAGIDNESFIKKMLNFLMLHIRGVKLAAHKAHFCGPVSISAQKLKLRGSTPHEGQGLLRPSQYTWSLGAEVHEQMSRSGGQSEARPPVFKSPSKLGTPS
ncbi:hypothetical protein TNCV_3218581 [Trichonephila clavipes]|nr:hypothetical protein TNCV_3218581 [Trichonephila clavipes]